LANRSLTGHGPCLGAAAASRTKTHSSPSSFKHKFVLIVWTFARGTHR